MEQYLVMFKLREDSYGGSEEEAAFMLADQIIPSLERLAEIENDHKVLGGFIEGQRSGGVYLFRRGLCRNRQNTLAAADHECL